MLFVTEPLIHWPDPIVELIGFLFSFCATGAVGFRLVVLGRRVSRFATADSERDVLVAAARRAAVIGAIGALGSLAMFALMTLPQAAARSHSTIGQLLATNHPTAMQLAALVAAALGLLLAIGHVKAGWYLAAAGVIVGPFTNVFFGQWQRAVNPVHRMSGGFWIGTLFVLLAAGFVATLRSDLPPIRRGLIAAEMVHSFSPLALAAAGLLALTGLRTAWTHIKHLEQLWTTPYGYALIAKLFVVAIVLGLGAWNWRKQRPLLGTESAAAVLRRSATAELLAATVVLIITAILVSLPSPH
jgi:copper transport protein